MRRTPAEMPAKKHVPQISVTDEKPPVPERQRKKVLAQDDASQAPVMKKGSLRTANELLPCENESVKDQANRIRHMYLHSVSKNRGARIRFLYAANEIQRKAIHAAYLKNEAAAPRTLQFATGQGELFRYLLKYIQEDIQARKLTVDNVQLICFATSLRGGNEQHNNMVTTDMLIKNLDEVYKRYLDGCDILGIPRYDAEKKKIFEGQYAIGGGQSHWFINKKIAGVGRNADGSYKESQSEYVQRQLERIQNGQKLDDQVEYDEEYEALLISQFTDMESNPDYHPALPIPVKAKKKYVDIYSDHVPILVQINGKKIISWNVMELDQFNGFAQDANISGIKETDEEQQARYKRIALSLKLSIQHNDPVHFITLQEICARDSGLLAEIMRSLGKDWGVPTKNVKDDIGIQNGVLTLYNKKLYKPYNFTEAHIAMDGNVSVFQSVKSDEDIVEILNVHSGHKMNPVWYEQAVKQFLLPKDTDPEKVPQKIVIGDFNCFIAPLNNQKQNIVTSVVHAQFRESREQGASAIDGAFYNSIEENCLIVRQASIEHLNPELGTVFKKQALAPVEVKNVLEHKSEEISQYRPIMCLDAAHTKKQWIQGNISEIQYQLFQRFQQPVIVREARNLNNESGLALIMDKDHPLANMLRERIERFSFDKFKYEKNDFIVCIPEQQVEKFFYMLERKDQKACFQLVQKIENQFFTYNNPGFFGGSRSVPKGKTHDFKVNIMNLIYNGYTLLAFIAVQNEMSAYWKNNPAKEESSFVNRLLAIRKELCAFYPELKEISDTFERYWNHAPMLMGQYANEVQKLIRELQIETDPTEREDLINTRISELCTKELSVQHPDFYKALLKGLGDIINHYVTESFRNSAGM